MLWENISRAVSNVQMWEIDSTLELVSYRVRRE